MGERCRLLVFCSWCCSSFTEEGRCQVVIRGLQDVASRNGKHAFRLVNSSFLALGVSWRLQVTVPVNEISASGLSAAWRSIGLYRNRMHRKLLKTAKDYDAVPQGSKKK